VEAATYSLLSVTVFQMSDETGLVLLSFAAGGTYTVDTLHMLDQLVGNLEDLLAVIAGQKLAARLVFSGMNSEVELLAEGHLAVLTLKSVLSRAQMFFTGVVFDDGQVVGRKVALVAVVPVSDVIVVNQGQDFVVGSVGGRASNWRRTLIWIVFVNVVFIVVFIGDVVVVVLNDVLRHDYFAFGTRFVSGPATASARVERRGRHGARRTALNGVGGEVAAEKLRIFRVDGAARAVGERVVRLDAVLLGALCVGSGSRVRASLRSDASSSGRSVFHLAAVVIFIVVDESVSPFLFPDFCGLKMPLRLLVFLEVGLLPEVNSARKTVERTDAFVNALVHVAVAGGSENLETQ
jgi:hypothetical protein